MFFIIFTNVTCPMFLHRYQGYISAALVLGGVDTTGAYLYTVYPHGSTDKLPYVTMGELCGVVGQLLFYSLYFIFTNFTKTV